MTAPHVEPLEFGVDTELGAMVAVAELRIQKIPLRIIQEPIARLVVPLVYVVAECNTVPIVNRLSIRAEWTQDVLLRIDCLRLRRNRNF